MSCNGRELVLTPFALRMRLPCHASHRAIVHQHRRHCSAPKLRLRQATLLIILVLVSLCPCACDVGRCFRVHFGTTCNAPALAKFIVALAQLRHRPDFNWMCSFLAEARAKVTPCSVC